MVSLFFQRMYLSLSLAFVRSPRRSHYGEKGRHGFLIMAVWQHCGSSAAWTMNVTGSHFQKSPLLALSINLNLNLHMFKTSMVISASETSLSNMPQKVIHSVWPLVSKTSASSLIYGSSPSVLASDTSRICLCSKEEKHSWLFD